MFSAVVVWARLARLGNALVAGLGVWLGWICVRAGDPALGGGTAFGLREAALGSAAMALLAAAGNMHNDVLDLEADRINRPDRALPAGRVSARAAGVVSAVLHLAAFGLGRAVSPAHGALTLGMGLLLLIYNLRLKRMPLLGNMAVSALCALAVYFPEFPRALSATALPVAFAFLTTLAREIAKDAEDMRGDAAVGWRTFPIAFGERAAARAVAGVVGVVLLLLPLPLAAPGVFGYRVGIYGVAALGPALLLLSCVRGLMGAERDWRKIQRGLKRAMVAGVIAIGAGVIQGPF